ncbi:MAG: hypothetical protein K6253_01135 [Candidatus Liberibacter asiaticus]|nr:hypothetical protein [Candidatus Liberibacter asiaticus]
MNVNALTSMGYIFYVLFELPFHHLKNFRVIIIFFIIIFMDQHTCVFCEWQIFFFLL